MKNIFQKMMFGSVTAIALIGVQTAQADATAQKVLNNYADIAHATYEDSLITSKELEKAINHLIKKPNAENLQSAKDAWLAARVPYQQSEAYRFGNTIVDEWEGKVNAWPLDEGLIDYVDITSYGEESDENPLYTANVIANEKLDIAGKAIDASKITKELIQDQLQEADEIESNVATGYHAIEFLLWGQDLNGTKAGAGKRLATDYDVDNCTNGNCARRAAYLQAAAGLLIDDLEWMTQQWAKDGAARKALLENDAKQGLSIILTGMGSLSYGELAGERMKLGLMLHDPEEEHDCFSDNTHNSHFYDAKGIQNVYLGKYSRIDGTEVSGASIAELVAAKDAAVDKELRSMLSKTMDKMEVLVDTAKKGEAYDQMIGEGNTSGNKIVMDAIEALTAQTKSIEKAVSTLGLSTLEIEGSDSLDAPEKVGS